ncbi:sensor histidine kinase [Paenibacillus sp. NPDC058174]|uniref:sensor histidine kinase n=1 Tax=Paenibacillus sp. NPDC058174 TaxID=3346366 RepID=UPI0036D84604
MTRFSQNFKNSLFVKIFIAVIVIQTLIILIFGQLNIARVTQFIEDREYEIARKDMLDLKDGYNAKLKQIRSNVFSLFIETNQSESVLEKINQYEGTAMAVDLRRKAEIQQFLQSMAYTDENIHSVLFIRERDGEKFAFIRYFDPSMLPNFQSIITFQPEEFVRIFPLEVPGLEAGTKNNYLTFALKVNDPNSYDLKQQAGTLVVSVSTAFLQKEGDHLRADSIFELKNGNGTVSMSGNSISIPSRSVDIEAAKKDTRNFFVSQVSNSADDMSFTLLISKNQLNENILAMKKNQWLTLMAIIVLNVVIAFYVSRGLSKRVITLTRNMRKYTPGEFVQPIPIQQNDEFTVLEETYNTLIQKLSEFIQKEYVLELKSKDAELQMLQSQVNPHFLSNMLEILRMQAIKENNMSLSDTIYQLSEIFRWNIRNKETLVTLYEELYYVEYYLKLQQFRYPRLQFKIDFPLALQNHRIAKFTVQPIVENIFKHAMNKGKEIDIQIVVVDVQDGIQLTVKDNGKGIKLETLYQIKAKLRMPLSHSSESPSVGLMNVHSRLQLIFGEMYGLDIESQAGEGTAVTIQFPKLER